MSLKHAYQSSTICTNENTIINKKKITENVVNSYVYSLS